MPSSAVYTALAPSRSDTGCSTVLIPCVEEEEPVMVTPEVVGRIDPMDGPIETNGERRNRQPAPEVSPTRGGHASDVFAEDSPKARSTRLRHGTASGGPRNRTWRCGFGDHRVTDTPVPRGHGIVGADRHAAL